MTRLARVLPIFLAVLPLSAADVPLSDRPLAPLAVQALTASASPDAVLIVFSDGTDLYAQRLRRDGSPLDPAAFFLATAPRAQTIWDGTRWLVFFGGSPVRLMRIDPSGAVDGPHDLDLSPSFDVAFAGGRTLVATRRWISVAAEVLSLHELADGPSLRPATLTLRVDESPDAWAAAVTSSPALITRQWLLGANGFRSAVFTVTAENHTAELVVPIRSYVANVAFAASRVSGGLFLWNDEGMHGAILRADGTISAPFAIGPTGTVREGILVSASDGGYDVLFRTVANTWIARVAESGAVDARPLATEVAPIDLNSPVLVPSGDIDLLITARPYPARGVDVRRIKGASADAPSTAGLGGAAQSAARAAAGAGLDLVAWLEQGADGPLLRATRIGANGAPLDGAGIVVADQSLFDTSRYLVFDHDVAFDGEAFVVAWLEHPDPVSRVVTRRIFPDGTISERAILASWYVIGGGVEVSGIGGGRSVVSWIGRETPSSESRSVLAILNGGVAASPVEIGSGKLGYSLPRLATSGDRLLAVFNDYTDCRILCAPDESPYARMFTLGGEPLGDPQLLTPGVGVFPEVVSDGEEFFVVWQKTLVRISRNFSIGPQVTLAREGDLSLEDGELVIDHGITRAIYSRAGTLLRFEPRGIMNGETAAVRLSHDRIVISAPAHPPQLMIRTRTEHPNADLAVVATGAVSVPWPGSGEANAIFRIEHRGGAPVYRIELWADATIFVPGQESGSSANRRLDRELREGETFEVAVRFYPQNPTWAEPRLWVAADALDPLPANNTDTYQRPARSRGRTVSR